MTTPDASTPPPPWRSLATLLAGSGVLHFVLPKPYESIVPKGFGDPKLLVQVSGVAELALAAGLALPRTRRLAALGSAALFVAVYPANLDMAAKAFRSPRSSRLWQAGVLARLPMQIPIVVRALRLARAS